MHFREIEILETDNNKKGDLFCRLMGDLFHALGYDEPRFNVHKSGREIDLNTSHRTEKKIAIAECKAHEDTVGGSDINKFVGVLDAERKKIKKSKGFGNHDVTGYFVSLSGFKETAIEQENELDNDRLILLKPQKVINELIAGKIIVSIEKAISSVPKHQDKLAVADYVDLFAYERGWVWAIYYSNGQVVTHFALIHADGKPLIKELASEIIALDKQTNGKLSSLTYIPPIYEETDIQSKIDDTKNRYFKYIENECGEIQFEGLPTDKDAGSVKVKLENIFVPLHLEEIGKPKEGSAELSDKGMSQREGIGDILIKKNRLAILAKPGGGKSTLIKRLATAYAYPERRKQVQDGLPDKAWFPIFVRCRELGDKVTSNITDIIYCIPNRAEISFCSSEFSILVSDALQKGNALLLIDGLDEIADDKNRIAFVNQLRTFLATYPNINIIVTSRETGFRVVGGSLAQYCTHYKISNLKDSEIEDLTIRWHKAIVDNSEKTVGEAKALAMFILKDNRLKVLAENPLLLTTLLFVKRWAGYLPTRKSVLYQEMIKLLLVTWNVEGHEQLDIEEAEPQLAFVAFWMTSKGRQTITVDELKECLLSARKQMPDILGYTKISVPEFIRRVESRSSLLIMSGHKKISTGAITPVYEFLHLSFQEYLTARAIVEKYIPKKDSKKSILDILKPHINDEAWKEIYPLVAALSKREAKQLIEYLISESIKTADEGKRKNRRIGEITPAELLGNCIANEIQITPDLLENALEWYAKNRPISHYSSGTIEVILNSKFGELFRAKVKECFFEKYDDKYAPTLGGLLGELYLIDLSLDYREDRLSEVISSIEHDEKENKCTAILALMEIAFKTSTSKKNWKAKPIIIDANLDRTLSVLLNLLKTNDLHYAFSASWCMAWLGKATLINDELRAEFVNTILNLWLNHSQHNLCRVSSWALCELIRPSTVIEVSRYDKTNIKDKILEKYANVENEFDKEAAICVGANIGMTWAKSEIESVYKGSRNKEVLSLFAEKMGIEILVKEGEK